MQGLHLSSHMLLQCIHYKKKAPVTRQVMCAVALTLSATSKKRSALTEQTGRLCSTEKVSVSCSSSFKPSKLSSSSVD